MRALSFALVSSALAGLAFALALGCGSGSGSPFGPDASSGGAPPDASQEGATITICGNAGQPCCNGSQCFSPASCLGITCGIPEGPDATVPSDAGADTGTGTDSGAVTDSGAATDTASGTDTGTATDAAPDCGTAPTLHPAAAGSIYCWLDSSGVALTCSAGTQCCIGGPLEGGTYDPDDCVAWGGACDDPVDGGFPVECEQPSDCTANGAAGAACCLRGSTGPQATAGCPPADLRAKGGAGIACESGGACAAGELQLCLQASDCPASAPYCVPFRWKVIELGYCASMLPGAD